MLNCCVLWSRKAKHTDAIRQKLAVFIGGHTSAPVGQLEACSPHVYLLLCLRTERGTWRTCRSTSVWLDSSQKNGGSSPSPCKRRHGGWAGTAGVVWGGSAPAGSDVHGLVGGAAEVPGAEAGQEVLGDGMQQRLELDLQPHLDQGFVLVRVYSGVDVQRPLQAEHRDSLHAGLLWDDKKKKSGWRWRCRKNRIMWTTATLIPMASKCDNRTNMTRPDW